MKAFIMLLAAAALCPAQKIPKDTISIKHRFYTAAFDTANRYPAVVRWWVTKSMVSCGEREDRTDRFTKDPALPRSTDLASDYKGSGYDRGHNMPAYDNGCDSAGMSECFYFTNMSPQTPTLNRGDWKELEEYTRDMVFQYDSVRVWCGAVGKVKKIGRVSVPDRFWKVLYIRKARRFEAFVFRNDTIPLDLAAHRTTTAEITKMTGLKIK